MAKEDYELLEMTGQYWRLLQRYLRTQWPAVAVVAAFLLAGIALQLANPQILRFFIDTATGDTASGDAASGPATTPGDGGALRSLTLAAALFLGVAVAQQIVSAGVTYFGESVAWRATNRLRADLALHCLRLDPLFHQTHPPGEMIERLDGDVTALANFFSQFVLLLVANALFLVGMILLLFREDWRIGAPLGVFTLVMLALLGRMQRRAVPLLRANRQASAALFAFLEERLAGIEDLQSRGAGAYVLRRFHEHAWQRFLSGRRAQLAGTLPLNVAQVAFVAGNALALGVSAVLFRADVITLGTVFLVYQYANSLAGPLRTITEQFQDLQGATASIQRLAELTQQQSAVRVADGRRQGVPAALTSGALEVAFDGVSFAYPTVTPPATASPDMGRDPASAGNPKGPAPGGASASPATASSTMTSPTAAPALGEASGEPGGGALEAPVLHEVTFRIQPGRVLGLLGRTGSGKSTIGRLLLRLYDPTAGAIRLAGTDLRALSSDDVRQRVGLVTQEVQLFHATVRDNLTLFDRSASDAPLREVLEQVGLGRWLSRQPAGLDTVLAAGGGGLSAGEAQLLAFARVFLRHPGLVILDEASSRLDPATEAIVERAIQTLLKGRTGIVIAHRLATVQRVDDILILEGGRAIEYGPRDSLARDGTSRFARLLRTGLQEVLS